MLRDTGSVLLHPCYHTPSAITLKKDKQNNGQEESYSPWLMHCNNAIPQPFVTLRASKRRKGKHQGGRASACRQEPQRTFDCPSPLPASTRVSSTVSPRLLASPSSPLVRRNCRIRVHVTIVLKTVSRRRRSRAVGEVEESQSDRGGHCIAR